MAWRKVITIVNNIKKELLFFNISVPAEQEFGGKERFKVLVID